MQTDADTQTAPADEAGAAVECTLKPGPPTSETIQEEAILDGALKLAAEGFCVFPCRNSPGQKGHKAPLTPRGYKDATTNAAQIRKWWSQYPRALIGFPTGAHNGVAVLDIDAKNGKHGFDAVPNWQNLSPLRSNTGSGGAHLFFRVTQPIRCATGSNGVDVRGEGGYVIVAPSPGYRWASGTDQIIPADLPPFPPAFIPSYHISEPSDEGLLAEEQELVDAALFVIPNPDEDWDAWNRIGMATWAATGGSDEGFEAFDTWSRKSTKYSIDATRDRWDHFFRSPPTQIGFGTLFYMAGETEPDWLSQYEIEREASASAAFEKGQAAYLEMCGLGNSIGHTEASAEGRESGDSAHSAGAERQEKVSTEPTVAEPGYSAEGPSSLIGEWDAGGDDWSIPPRAWLLGNTYCRQFVSSLLATGGGGKTATRLLQAISCATGRALTGEKVFQRCRVLYISLEDDQDELRRRVLAAIRYHNIPASELSGHLFLAAPGQKAGKLVTSEPSARSRKSNEGRVRAGVMLEEVRRTIKARQIDLLLFDPLVKMHDVEENDNSAMDFVISTLTELAIDYNIAVDVLHHTSKGAADPGNADRGRGASAVNNGARLVYTLSGMSVDEARTFNIAENERRSYIRIDSGKVNIAPALRDAKWFQIVGVDLRNGSTLYPSGDNVQTVIPWTPPDTWEGATDDVRRRILDAIEAGVPEADALKNKPGSRYSRHHNAAWRTAWPLVHRHLPDKSDQHCKDMINDWVKIGMLIEEDYTDPNTSQKAKGLRLVTPEDDRKVAM